MTRVVDDPPRGVVYIIFDEGTEINEVNNEECTYTPLAVVDDLLVRKNRGAMFKLNDVDVVELP